MCMYKRIIFSAHGAETMGHPQKQTKQNKTYLNILFKKVT